jgi:hypothetical protein
MYQQRIDYFLDRDHRLVNIRTRLKQGSQAIRRAVLAGVGVAVGAGRRACHHGGTAEQAHVELSGDINGRYVVTDRRAGGELTLVPDTSAEAIRERAGLLDATPEQAEAFWRENEPHMLPPDDEP